MTARWSALFFGCLLCAALGAMAQPQLWPGDPIKMDVTASATKVTANGIVTFSVTAMDCSYAIDLDACTVVREDDTCTVTDQATGGTLVTVPQSPYAQPSVWNYTWTAPSVNGAYAILFTVQNSGRYALKMPVSNITQITVTGGIAPAHQYALQLVMDPAIVDATKGETRAVVKVHVIGDDVAGKTVSLLASDGHLATPTVVTDAGGDAQDTLTLQQDNDPSIDVVASLGAASMIATLPITVPNTSYALPPNSPGVALQATPFAQLGNDLLYHLTTRLTDTNGAPLPLRPVVFKASAGKIIAPQLITDQDGVATTLFTASLFTAYDPILITVNAATLNGSTKVDIRSSRGTIPDITPRGSRSVGIAKPEIIRTFALGLQLKNSCRHKKEFRVSSKNHNWRTYVYEAPVR